MLVCALGLYEWIDTIVALGLTFLFILVNPISLWLTVNNYMLRGHIAIELGWRLPLARFRVCSSLVQLVFVGLLT
jgi:hypothetical protein